MKWLWSFLSIIFGYVAVLIVIMSGFAAFEKTALKLHPVTLGLLILTTIACLGGATGGYVAAAIAPSHRLRHATILGALMMLFGLVLAANAPLQPQEPLWYHWGVPILALPTAIVGGRLRSKT